MAAAIPRELPQTIKNFALNAYTKAKDFISAAPAKYKEWEGKAITKLETTMPDQKEQVVKIARAVPEILFAGCMLTGALKPVSVLYTAARCIWTITPYIQKLLQGDFGKEARTEATKASLEKLQELHNKLKPAVFVACGVAACVSALFGLAALTPIHLARAGFLASLSYMGYQGMMAPSQPVVATPAPAPEPAPATTTATQP